MPKCLFALQAPPRLQVLQMAHMGHMGHMGQKPHMARRLHLAHMPDRLQVWFPWPGSGFSG
jgi:hypothetical protein